MRFEFLGLHALGFMRIVMHVNKSFKVPLSFDVANGIGIECNSLLFCRPKNSVAIMGDRCLSLLFN